MLWTPVRLNVHTLSRVLSDTAQGPVEPPENAIVPQLPGEEGKPILWSEVVGSAPFFLRFDEWLARQQPFFAENLFALRSQVVGVARGRPWLNDDRKKFLEFHRARPANQPMTPYTGLLRHGGRSAPLGRVPAQVRRRRRQADRTRPGHRQGPVRHRRAACRRGQAAARAAAPDPVGGENWEPEVSAGSFRAAAEPRQAAQAQGLEHQRAHRHPHGRTPPTGSRGSSS